MHVHVAELNLNIHLLTFDHKPETQKKLERILVGIVSLLRQILVYQAQPSISP